MGEHTMLRPATREDNQEVKDLITSTSQLEKTMTRLEGYVWNATQIGSGAASTVQLAAYSHHHGYTHIPALPYNQAAPNTMTHYPTQTRPIIPSLIPVPTTDKQSFDEEAGQYMSSSNPLDHNTIQDRTCDLPCPLPSSNIEGLIPGVVIPNLAGGPGAWKKAIDQWEKGGKGMSVPLKDWPVEWYTGYMRKVTGAKRAQRQIIYDEYIRSVRFSFLIANSNSHVLQRLGRDDESFIERYPEANKSVRKLLEAIRKQGVRKRRKSKNGTPFQRDSSESNHGPASEIEAAEESV